MFCISHPDRRALGVCVHCGKAYCPDCLINIKGRMYCKKHICKIVERDRLAARQRRMKRVGLLIPTKSRMSAALLAFTLGWAGGHKFYLGQSGQGILYLLFFWTGLPLIISIAEGIAYLFTSDHIFARKYGGQIL